VTIVFVHIYSDGCNGFRVSKHTFTRPASSCVEETTGVWRDEGGDSFFVEVPAEDPVEPQDEDDCA
jgi:hypothetical protein